MYRDTEQSYGEYTLDVDEGENGWRVDWWLRSNPDVKGVVERRKRKEAIEIAKQQIDSVESKRAGHA